MIFPGNYAWIKQSVLFPWNPFQVCQKKKEKKNPTLSALGILHFLKKKKIDWAQALR